MAIKIGETIGDYRVVRELGAGGMGAVYEVKHLISDRTEAMKLLLPNLEAKPELARRFLREIQVHASLSHPGIATLHTALRHDNQLLMVMEFVKGESLDRYLRHNSLEVSTALCITSQLLRALSYAHSRSVIHRDIKPANVMLLDDGGVKLLDFGIARLIASPGLTVAGAVIGSLHYMSPEQLRGLPVDVRTDIYSTGVTLYEMLTGGRPFSSADPYAIMRATLETEAACVNSLNPAVPPELSRIVQRAMHRDPNQRPQTAEQMLAELEHCPVPAGAIPAPPRERKPEASPVPASSSGQPTIVLFEPEALEHLSRTLAAFIGPVARIFVSRTARKSTSWTQLYQTLAAEVPKGPDRDKFLASCQSVILRRK